MTLFEGVQKTGDKVLTSLIKFNRKLKEMNKELDKLLKEAKENEPNR